MAKENKNSKGKVTDNTEKPLPLPRPGTSGTENLLMTTRREASEQFIKAQRAEKAYRAKKQASLARTNYNETKNHFKEGFSHLKLAFKGVLSVIKAIPYLISEKKEKRRMEAEATKRKRELERKKKLEEALAKQAAEDDADGEEKPE